MALYKIRNYCGELTGSFVSLSAAKREADRLCNVNERKQHFTVVELRDVYVTSTLDEAIATSYFPETRLA